MYDKSVQSIKLSDNSYIIVATQTEDKDVQRFARKNYNIPISERCHMAGSNGRLLIYEVEILPFADVDECLEGIKKFILG